MFTETHITPDTEQKLSTQDALAEFAEAGFPNTKECRMAIVAWAKNNLPAELLEGIDSFLFQSLEAEDMYLVVTDMAQINNVSIAMIMKTLGQRKLDRKSVV